jgi:hypothetical protein
LTARTGVRITGDVASWQTRKCRPVNFEHLAANSTSGHLHIFTWSPENDWYATDVTALTNIRDRDFRIDPDLRKPDDKIGDLYDWQALHHMHCLVRCFVNGATLEREVFGSLGAFAAKSEGWRDEFDYGDLFDAQTMLLWLGDVALVTTFNDACGAIQGAMPRLERIEGPLSEIQAREVMADFAFMNLSLKERPKFYTECDTQNETNSEKAIMPEHFELGELDYALRGQLLRRSFGDGVNRMQAVGKTPQEIEQLIDDGRFTVLFDENGTFLKQSFTPPHGKMAN